MEDIILNNELHIFDRPGQPFTFSSPNGENNIDLHLATGSALNKVENSGDHELIEMRLTFGVEPIEQESRN